jgi:hypothetical protein
MKRLLPVLLMVIGVFLGSAGESFALPECPGSFNKNSWNNCKGRVEYPDGSYVGTFKNGIPDGRGSVLFKTGAKYIGEIKQGKSHGRGVFVDKNGKYEGEFKDGAREGQGTFTPVTRYTVPLKAMLAVYYS